MKKSSLFILLGMILCLASVAQAEMNIFYLPDNGYLRVEGELLMEPTFGPLSLLIFPNAQITEFWVEGLQTYQVERGAQGTLITFSLGEVVNPSRLDLAYEGFLPQRGDQITLDRDTLWFPEFSFPVKPPTFTLESPLDWEVEVPKELQRELKKNSVLISWQTPSQSYPQFSMERRGFELGKGEADQTTLVPEPELPVRELPPVQEEFLSKIQIQVARLVNLINARNLEGLENIISVPLQEQGLPHYLVNVPKTFGQLTSEFHTQPTYAEEPFQVIIGTQKGSQFLATMSWQEINGIMVLQTFSLIPAGLGVPEVVEQSLTEFVQTLQQATEAGNKDRLELAINPKGRVEQISEFFSTLNTEQVWEIKYIALEPLSITVLVPHSSETKLLLNMGLSPGEENWLIDTLDVVPLR